MIVKNTLTAAGYCKGDVESQVSQNIKYEIVSILNVNAEPASLNRTIGPEAVNTFESAKMIVVERVGQIIGVTI